MYSPKQNDQAGGDYTYIQPDGTRVNIAQSTMDLIADLAAVSSFADMKEYINLNSLSPLQLTNLLSALSNQIVREDQEIETDNAKIQAYTLEINTPFTGLQARYESTIESYNIAQIKYDNSVSASTLNADLVYSYTSTIEYLSTLDQEQLSTLRHYEDEYSTILVQVRINTHAVSDQQAVYDMLSTSTVNYLSEYNTINQQYINEMTTVSTDNTALQTAYAKYLASLSQSDLSDVNRLSSIYTQDLGIANNLSTILVENIGIRHKIEPLLISTHNSITTLAFNSTIFADPYLVIPDIQAYIDQITGTLNGYISERASLLTRLGITDISNNDIPSDNESLFNNLLGKISAFYTKAETQATNELLSYQYQVEEWSAFVGFVVTNLLIQKAYIALEINGFTMSDFTTTVPVPSGQKPLSELRTINTGIQTIVDNLNVMDASFNEVIGICENEMNQRRLYINTMNQMTSLQADVFGGLNTTNGISATYANYNNTLTGALGTIHSYQTDRLNKMSNIMTTISPHLQNVTVLIDRNNITFDGFTYPAPINTDSTPFATDPAIYQIFPPLQT